MIAPFLDLKKSGIHIFHLPITVRFYYFLVQIDWNSHRSSMFWRSLSSLHTLLAGGVGLLMLELLVGYQPVQAQSCTVDPLGGEVCLPDPIPETPNQPEIPDESIETQEQDQPEKSDEPETIDQPDKPNPMAVSYTHLTLPTKA